MAVVEQRTVYATQSNGVKVGVRTQQSKKYNTKTDFPLWQTLMYVKKKKHAEIT